jgi:membrane associated rhomboid family serine protease
MREPTAPPTEQLLRLIAAAAPGPWYPRVFEEQRGVDRRALDALLEELWLRGLIERAGGSPETGPGVALTARGREVLADPGQLARFRAGEPLAEGDRWAVIRRALVAPAKPVLTRLLIAANVAVFVWGIYLASRQHPSQVNEYLAGGTERLLHDCGGVTRNDIKADAWVRLMSSTFVHAGLMHLLFNMFGLYVLGRQAEAMWGRWRYLLVYLAAAWVGSCAGVARSSDPRTINVGASGAICGLLGADLVWVLANRRHLPSSLRRRAFSGVLINLALIALISVAPGISGWGHLGGLLGGAAAAALLHVQRFGPRPLRWPALAAVALVPLAGFLVLRQSLANGPEGPPERGKAFEAGTLTHARRELAQATTFYRKEAEPVLDVHPTRRNPRDVDRLRPELARWRERLATLAATLESAGRRSDADEEAARVAARDYAAAFARLYELADDCLAAGEGWTPARERQLQEQARQVQELRAAWLDRWE